MSSDSSPSSSARSRTVVITWVLACVMAAYLAENLWIDEWARSKFSGLPGLMPVPLSSFWFVMFGLGGICCVLLLVCLVLVSQHKHLSLRTKICTGAMVVVACALWGVWFGTTSGASSGTSGRRPVAAEEHKKHSVKLTWVASTSAVAGYNVYRSTNGKDYVRINSELVKVLTYTDDTVESGKTYFYVTRAVDGKGKESGDSNFTEAVIP